MSLLLSPLQLSLDLYLCEERGDRYTENGLEIVCLEREGREGERGRKREIEKSQR
jgi:hypothetical protein